MPPHTTPAVLLHAFDYLESSRIIRLLTRDLGLRSVLARGARRSSKRFGSSLDLFVQGNAELDVKPGRDLDTLGSFDVTRSRAAIGQDLARFAGAAAIAELVLRFAQADTDAELFDVTVETLDAIALAPAGHARDAAIRGAWRILVALGFGPSLDECNECHRAITGDEAVLFSYSEGGVLCVDCARRSRAGRKIPAAAREALVAWMSGGDVAPLGAAEAKAHQRLLREFVHEHLSDGRPLKAFDSWETAEWSAA